MDDGNVAGLLKACFMHFKDICVDLFSAVQPHRYLGQYWTVDSVLWHILLPVALYTPGPGHVWRGRKGGKCGIWGISG